MAAYGVYFIKDAAVSFWDISRNYLLNQSIAGFDPTPTSGLAGQRSDML
jgi:hypothetical protein